MTESNKTTVEAERRRRDPNAGETPRPRAEAPRREPSGRSTGGGGSGGSSSGSGSFGGGGSSPLGGMKLPAWAVVLLVIGYLIFSALSGGDDSGGADTGQELLQPVEEEVLPVESPTARPTRPAVAAGEGATWLVMLYQDADDKILEQDIYLDLNEAERVGSSENVKIVAQVDRFRSGFDGDGDWSGARRYFVTYDDDFARVGSEMVQDLGEVNMADSRTLSDFVTWAVAEYPADKYVLILSDHGMGWPGGWSDSDSKAAGNRDIPLANAIGDHLFLMELDQTLGEIRNLSGIDQFELIGMDACLMGHVEVYSALAPHARYAVTSQETEPALGWAYTSFLGALQADPNLTGADLGRLIVESYIQEDQRIVNDQARAEFLRQGSPMGGFAGFFGGLSADQLSEQMAVEITLAAVDLSITPELVANLNQFAYALQDLPQEQVAQARSYAQSFTSIFGQEVPASYIDLGHFAQLVQRQAGNAKVTAAVQALQSSIEKAVIAEKHGSKRSGATGVSIYFPNSTLYRSPAAGPQSYTVIANRFAQDSLWDEFLLYHYSGDLFELSTGGVANSGGFKRAPGQGQIQVSAINLSSSQAAAGSPVTLSADIGGSNIGYVKLFVGYYDQNSSSIAVVDMDYLEAPETRELNGVYYPEWGSNDFTLRFSWEPIVFGIDDGTQIVPALFTPQTYGATFEEAVYTVNGIYTFVDGEQRYARLAFSNGVLHSVIGFSEQDGSGSAREIIPQNGDTFTLLDMWMDLDATGAVVKTDTQVGATLTFGEQAFLWREMDAAGGDYLVGYIVEDLDGNSVAAYSQITVK